MDQKSSRVAKVPLTFVVQTATDMLDLLRWNLSNLEKDTGSSKVAAYHAIHCALIGWHLHEWICVEANKTPQGRLALAKLIGVPPQIANKPEHLGVWAAKNCPAIAACQAIATSAKHVGYEAGSLAQTHVSAQAKTIAIPIEGPVPSGIKVEAVSFTYPKQTAKVIDADGKATAVANLIRECIVFWDDVIKKVTVPV